MPNFSRTKKVTNSFFPQIWGPLTVNQNPSCFSKKRITLVAVSSQHAKCSPGRQYSIIKRHSNASGRVVLFQKFSRSGRNWSQQAGVRVSAYQISANNSSGNGYLKKKLTFVIIGLEIRRQIEQASNYGWIWRVESNLDQKLINTRVFSQKFLSQVIITPMNLWNYLRQINIFFWWYKRQVIIGLFICLLDHIFVFFAKPIRLLREYYEAILPL